MQKTSDAIAFWALLAVTPQRPLDVLAMHHHAQDTDGAAALLSWLARRTACWVGLLDRSGAVIIEARPDVASRTRPSLGPAIQQMVKQEAPAFAAYDDAGLRTTILAVGVPRSIAGPLLAIHGQDGAVPPWLAADAAVVLGTCWMKEDARRVRDRLDAAEAQCRESVLHLLMSGNTATANQVASTLLPHLPDPVRVHVVECAPGRKTDVIQHLEALTAGRAWTVRCPVYKRHIIALAPNSPSDDLDESPEPLEAALTAAVRDCVIGVGDVVELRNVAVGYEQAFHALAVARRQPERLARFDGIPADVTTSVGEAGYAWARRFLAPLIEYVPTRQSDPDALELMTTARSWLAFSSGATRHLKIHKNTLQTRLKRISEILSGAPLSRLEQQSMLDLALRILAAPDRDDKSSPRAPGGFIELDELLLQPCTLNWARSFLEPLLAPRQRSAFDAATLEKTLRVWLRSDARLAEASQVLGLSNFGIRRRIMRIEEIFQRSLLHAPSARYDLWLALRAIDLDRERRRIGESDGDGR